jgi:hypothetical protein
MFAMLLLGITRCATAELCPDDDALIAAVQARDDARVSAISAQAAQENPGAIIFAHAVRIKGISDVICGEALPGDLPTITCKFTVRYWSRNSYQVARLMKKNGVWAIEEALGVSRERK